MGVDGASSPDGAGNVGEAAANFYADADLNLADSHLKAGDESSARQLLQDIIGRSNVGDAKKVEAKKRLDSMGSGTTLPVASAENPLDSTLSFLQPKKGGADDKVVAQLQVKPDNRIHSKENEKHVPLEEIKSILRSALESNSSIKSVTKLEISGATGGLQLDIEIETSAGKAAIAGLVASEESSLMLKDLKVKANPFIRSHIRSQITNSFSNITSAIKTHFENQYNQPVSSIQAGESGLIVKFEIPQTQVAVSPAPVGASEVAVKPAEKVIDSLPGIEAHFSAAREAFVMAERNRDKYLKKKDDSPEKIKAEAEYAQAQKIYEKARAEMVGGDIGLFLKEETKLADSRILSATEKRGTFEKISNAWKWLGDQNLEKLGWKPEGRFGRIIARGVNARMAIGVSLIGIGYFAPPVAFLTLGVRRLMSGVGAAVLTDEWLKSIAEVPLTTFSEKELNSIASSSKIGRHIGEMIFGLRLQGKLASESADFQKLMARYEEVLKKEYEIYESARGNLLANDSESITRRLRLAKEDEKDIKIIRRILSLGAGALAAVGVDVFRYLYAGEHTGLLSIGRVPHIETPPIMEMPPKPPVAAIETPKPDAESVGNAIEKPNPEGAKPDSGGAPSSQQPETGAGQQAEGDAKPDGEKSGTPAEDKAQTKEAAKSEGAPTDTDKDKQGSTAKESADGKPAETAEPNEAGAKAEKLETSKLEIPNSFEITVQAGEGPIHEARKAISEYIALSGDEQLKGLTKAQRILAEEKLYRAVKDSLPEWKVGATISFDKDIIEKTLGVISEQTQEQIAVLDKNLAPYVDNVKWARYDVEISGEAGEQTINRPWESDEGIRRAPSAPVDLEKPRLDEIKLRPEIESHIPVEVDGEKDVPKLEEIILEEGEEIAKAKAISGTDPALSRAMLAEAGEAREVALNSAIENTAWKISRIYPEEYQSIKNLKISDVLKLGYFGNTAETTWPSAGEPNQMNLIKKMKLRDSFAAVIKALSPEERGSAAKMTIHQFIRTYYQERVIERSFA